MNFDLAHPLHLMKCPMLYQGMRFLNLFDCLFFYYIFVACVWFAYDQKIGARFFFLFVLSLVVNQGAKEFCALLRHLKVEHAHLYGFPSGAAQGMVTLLGFLALKVRKTWFWFLTIFLVLLVSYSRVYIGTHNRPDIIEGWAIGVALLAIYVATLPIIERFLVSQSKSKILVLSGCATLILCFLCRHPDAKALLVSGFGASVGLSWATQLAEPQNLYQRIGRALIAILGLYFLHQAMAQASHNVWLHTLEYYGAALLIGFWLSFGVPFLCSLVQAFKKS
jgi:hypothetical protein